MQTWLSPNRSGPLREAQEDSWHRPRPPRGAGWPRFLINDFSCFSTGFPPFLMIFPGSKWVFRGFWWILMVSAVLNEFSNGFSFSLFFCGDF